METKKYFPSLSILRIFGAFLIVTMHVYVLGSFAFNNSYVDLIVRHLSCFVELFFLLSGFSISCGYFDRILNGSFNDIKKYYISRFIKIVPLFLIINLIEMVLTFEFPQSLVYVFSNMTMLFGFMSNAAMPVASLGWTLGVIFCFYLLFPFIVSIMSSRKGEIIALIISFLLFVVMKYFFVQTGERQNIILWLFHFVLGVSIYKNINIFRKMESKIWIFVLYIVFVVCATVGYFALVANSFDVSLITPFLFSAWIIMFLNFNGEIFEKTFFKYVGTISFDVYLLQMLVFRFVEKCGAVSYFKQFDFGFFVVLVIVLMILIIASLCWEFINSKIQPLLKKLFLRKDNQ